MSAALLYWPYVGLVLAVALVARLVTEPRGADAGPRWRDPAFILPLLWPMYLIHQFEEHGIDMLGRPYAFLGALCATLGHGPGQVCPADPPFIFAVNAVGCWIAFASAFIFRRSHPMIAACAWGIPLINAQAHILPSLRGGYNPGLLTSILLFVPLCAWMIKVMRDAGLLRLRQVGWIALSGVLTHAVLLSSLKLREAGLPHPLVLSANCANGLWPIALGLLASRLSPRRPQRPQILETT